MIAGKFRTMSNSISQELTIIEIGGENRIDSRIVAESLGIEHESLNSGVYIAVSYRDFWKTVYSGGA